MVCYPEWVFGGICVLNMQNESSWTIVRVCDGEMATHWVRLGLVTANALVMFWVAGKKFAKKV